MDEGKIRIIATGNDVDALKIPSGASRALARPLDTSRRSAGDLGTNDRVGGGSPVEVHFAEGRKIRDVGCA
jgi:hypothetical protein